MAYWGLVEATTKCNTAGLHRVQLKLSTACKTQTQQAQTLWLRIHLYINLYGLLHIATQNHALHAKAFNNKQAA